MTDMLPDVRNRTDLKTSNGASNYRRIVSVYSQLQDDALLNMKKNKNGDNKHS